MKVSLLLAGISFVAAGVAGASTPAQTNSIPQPVVEMLHTAFLGANNLGMAEGIANGDQYQSPIPVDVQTLANRFESSCTMSESSNNQTQTINGSNCPISDKSSWNVTGNQSTANVQYADSVQITDPNLRSQLSLVSASSWTKGIQSQTQSTFSANMANHNEIVTVTNHKIVLDYTNIYNGTNTNGPNGETDFQIQHMSINGTMSFDGQKHTGSMASDAGAENKTYTCAIDGAPIDCETFTYIFGFVQPSMNVIHP